jgi:hypothetical protein
VPFTLSHVAAVLPLRRGRASRWALPAAPLVLGSMAPDLVMVLDRPALRSASHSLVGSVTVDLPLVAVTWLLWVHLVREPVAQLLPGVGARWRPARRGTRGERLVRWLAAALAGIATHLLWDSFTHRDGWTVRHVAALQSRVMDVRIADWLQLGSSVLGLLVLAWWAVQWWRHTEQVGRARRSRGALPVLATLVVLAGFGAAHRAGPILPELLRNPFDGGAWRAFVTLGLFGAGAGALFGVLLAAALWHLIDPPRVPAER